MIARIICWATYHKPVLLGGHLWCTRCLTKLTSHSR